MGDFIFDNFGWILFIVIVGVFALMFFALKAESENKQRLMAQCQADGKQEYECYAMLRDPTPVVMPVATPIYVGR